MFTVIETVRIARSPDEVFAFLTDPGNRSRWDASVVSEELTSPEPVGVGSTIRTRMSAMGREVEFDWRVTRFDPPLGMAVVSTEGIMPTATAFAFAAADAGCEVTATIDGRPSGMLLLAEPIVAATVRTTLGTALARAKVLLEGG